MHRKVPWENPAPTRRQAPCFDGESWGGRGGASSVLRTDFCWNTPCVSPLPGPGLWTFGCVLWAARAGSRLSQFALVCSQPRGRQAMGSNAPGQGWLGLAAGWSHSRPNKPHLIPNTTALPFFLFRAWSMLCGYL